MDCVTEDPPSTQWLALTNEIYAALDLAMVYLPSETSTCLQEYWLKDVQEIFQ